MTPKFCMVWATRSNWFGAMGTFANFAISFSVICIVAGGITSYPTALASGGGFSVAIGWLIGGAFALVVATSLAQIGSSYPTAGGLYHWSSILGSRGWGWATAWINLFGLVFILSSVDVGVYLIFKGLVAGPILGLNPSLWGLREQALALAILLVTQGAINHVGITLIRFLINTSWFANPCTCSRINRALCGIRPFSRFH